jgi:hypothetical protein
MPQKILRLLILLLIARTLSGCGTGGPPAPGVAKVTITSSLSSIAVSGTEQIAAAAQDSSGNIIIGAALGWASSKPSVATISAGSGLAMGLLPGMTQITASANGITSAPVTLTVTPGFLAISPMIFARGRTTYTVLNDGNVLIAAGSNSGGILATAELYIPSSQTFSVTGNLNVARYSHSATLLNDGMVLIAGGVGSSGLTNSAELYNPATGTFSLTGNLIAARDLFTATHLPNGMVLIAGGVGANGPLATAELYDPTTSTFEPTGQLNVPRSIATATLLNNGLVLIAGGTNSSGALSSAELYDPETGTFALTGSMSTARYAHTGTLLNNGMVLAAGGSLPSAGVDVPLNSAELYNPATDTFSVTGNLNTARLYASATLLNNGTVLLAGGDSQTNPNSTPLTSAELYDPTAGTFTVTGSLVNPRATKGSALLANGEVLLAGGYDLPVKAPAELYEPGPLTPPGLQSITVAPASPTVSPGAYQKYVATGTFAGGAMQKLAAVAWSSSDTNTAQVSNDATNPGASVAVGSPASTIPVTVTAAAGNVSGSATLNVRPAGFVTTGSMTVPREVFHAVTLNNGQVLVVDGEGFAGGPLPAELYNPALGTFAVTGTPIAQRFSYTATLLPNGTVLIAGGNFGTALASAELYNPATGTFSSTGSMNVARYDHTATLLVNGTVLITGGRITGTTALASAEIYDPGSGTFTPAGNLSFARAEHTATPIAGGNVLIAGGQFNGGSFPATAEIYNAFSGLFSTVGSLNVPRFDHTATLLQNGTVLIAGGAGIGSDLASTELYDPATGMFTFTGSLNTPRLLHTATLLNSGMVLLAGGGNNVSPGGVLASAELYNPLTGTFTNAGALNAARLNHAASLMENGMVLVVGGAAVPVLNSAELY